MASIPGPQNILSILSAPCAPGRNPLPTPNSILSELSASKAPGRNPLPTPNSIVQRDDVKHG
jgi:hypothetical protein